VAFDRVHPCFSLTTLVLEGALRSSVGSGGIRSCAPVFFSEHLVSKGAFEALLVINIMGLAFFLHGDGGECHGSQNLRTSNGGSSLCGNEELAW
jgi:hypothetical protein